MLNTDVDGFRITDEKGLRLFAFTTNGLRILQFANARSISETFCPLPEHDHPWQRLPCSYHHSLRREIRNGNSSRQEHTDPHHSFAARL